MVNFTVINKEPRAIFHGVINADEGVFITAHYKLRVPVINMVAINYGA